MQNATHLASGILIQKATAQIQDASLRRLLVALLGLFSHGVLDMLARVTYHPTAPRPDDPFWVTYHTSVYAASALVLVTNGRSFKSGMFWASAPDLDWVARLASRRLPANTPLWREPVLHNALHKLIDALPGLNLLNRLPDWRSKKQGALVEIALLVVLAMLIRKSVERDASAP